MEEPLGPSLQERILSLAAGASKLVDFYGYWPSFHDARVETITLECEGPTVTTIFTTYDRVVKGGQEQRDELARVTVRWYEVEDLTLRASEWAGENWVWEMHLTFEEGQVRSDILSNEGIGGSILARRMEVLEVLPLSP